MAKKKRRGTGESPEKALLAGALPLVAHSGNTLAFERHCIGTRVVALLTAYQLRVRLSQAPCWHSASTLSVRDRISEKDHLGGRGGGEESLQEMERLALSGGARPAEAGEFS